MRKGLFVPLTFIIGIAILTLSRCGDEKPKITPLSKSWEKAVPHQEVPEGLSSLSAEHCGACHQEHYKEWKQSTHAHAWTDLQFQAELKKETSPFLCINCHIPLQNQQEFIIDGLYDGDIYSPVKRKNPNFDKNLQQEGINCASCHVRDNVIIGPTGTSKAPHKTRKDVNFLSEKLCISCHNATAVVTPTLACSFETGDEWKAGPYFEKKNCISCHMEPLEREVVHGYGERPSRIHNFAGSGIPKFDTVETNMLTGLEFKAADLKQKYSLNESLSHTLQLKNAFAGHKIPTGDPERFILISFKLIDEKGEVVAEKTERIGEHWSWYPVAKKLSDNNLLPLEEREYKFTHQFKSKEKLKLSVVVTKHRLDGKSATYNKLGDNYPLFITLYEKEYSIIVK